MTEKQPAHDDLSKELALLAALHVHVADVVVRIAEASNQREFLLRRDMQENYRTAIEEARELFRVAQRDIAQLRQQVGDQHLPAGMARTIDAIEDDLSHIKQMIPAIDASDPDTTN